MNHRLFSGRVLGLTLMDLASSNREDLLQLKAALALLDEELKLILSPAHIPYPDQATTLVEMLSDDVAHEYPHHGELYRLLVQLYGLEIDTVQIAVDMANHWFDQQQRQLSHKSKVRKALDRFSQLGGNQRTEALLKLYGLQRTSSAEMDGSWELGLRSDSPLPWNAKFSYRVRHGDAYDQVRTRFNTTKSEYSPYAVRISRLGDPLLERTYDAWLNIVEDQALHPYKR